MKYIYLVTLICGLLCHSSIVQAQAFAPQSGVNTNNVPAAPKAQMRQSTPNENNVGRFSEENLPLLSEAAANFSEQSILKNSDGENYDNSRGKVIEFRMVDGKIIFENDIDKRKILVYYDNFKINRGFDNITKCSLRVYVLNDLLEKINNISFKLIWPEISTSLQLEQIPPGANTYTDIMLLGDGCFSMDKTPVVEVNRCRVKGKTQEQCADAVNWYVKKQN